jgi:hypothetical protein
MNTQILAMEQYLFEWDSFTLGDFCRRRAFGLLWETVVGDRAMLFAGMRKEMSAQQ